MAAPDQYRFPYFFTLHISLRDKKYMISTSETNEKPVKRPRIPPQLAKKSTRPNSSFLSAGMNCASLKNMVKRLKCTLKATELL